MHQGLAMWPCLFWWGGVENEVGGYTSAQCWGREVTLGEESGPVGTREEAEEGTSSSAILPRAADASPLREAGY